MTAEISDLIKKIKSKFIELNDKFNEELNKNNYLYAEIKATKSSLQEQKEKNGSLELEIKHLKEHIKTLNSQESKTISNQDKDLEIDMLVREIDHCIQTLKKN